MGEVVGTYALTLFVVSVLFAAVSIVHAQTHRRREQVRSSLERCYLSILNRRLLEGGATVCHFPLIERRSSRLTLARVVAQIGAVTYGYDRRVLSEVVRRYELDKLLLEQTRLSGGMRRVQWLHTLAQVECDERTYRRMIKRFTHSHNRYIALCVTLAALNHSPERCIAILAERERRLSPFDLAEVLMMLKRGLIPVAYQPLLRAEQTNVRLLGLCIVRYFGVTEAEEEIVAAIATPDREVAEAALFTLCALRLRLERDEVQRAAERMSVGERRAWYRHLASEGYSAQAIAHVLPAEDRGRMHDYVEQAVASYKRLLTN
ncbi:MAG: hypothetical protein IKK35_02600 [Rikenellaceae bacterium]|nr:hypothetical protein [Rikenellaceae bacterium]